MARLILALAGAILLGWSQPVTAAEFRATSTDLAATMKAAQPGDVIKISGEGWGDQNWRALVKAAPGITVEADGPVTFRSLKFSGTEGVTVRGVDYEAVGQQAVLVASSKRIAVENCRVTGDPAISDGVWVRWSEDVAVRGCRFQRLWHGVFHEGNTRFTLEDSDFRDIYSDAVRGGLNSDGVTLRRLHITDLHQVGGDHLDAIQFWTTRATQPTRNVLIEDVIYRRGNGDPAQAVLIGDEGKVGNLNFTIRRVAAVGGLYNGISLAGAVDPVIEDSYVQPMEGSVDANGKAVTNVWIQTRGSTGGQVRNSYASLVQSYQNVSPPTVSGFTAVPIAKAGDYSGLEAWLKRNDPPADPRDARIAELTAQLAAANDNIAKADAAANALRAELAQAHGEVSALTARWRSLVDEIGALASRAATP